MMVCIYFVDYGLLIFTVLQSIFFFLFYIIRFEKIFKFNEMSVDRVKYFWFYSPDVPNDFELNIII